MSNKTFIPAFQARVGDWKYYICTMKYAEVARQVSFAHELGGNQDLGLLIQRGISNRTKGITEYLLKSTHRFLGSIVVAAWLGEPTYTALTMDDPEGMLSGIDQGFGVLTFDGTQSYFALDGQHRLKAIKDAVKLNPELQKEDICVLMVTHYDTPEGRMRTRRLFTNINRNAKQTGAAENIALDEDDGYAIVTRRILEEHDLLKQPGRVRVILATTEEGGLKLASSSIPKADPAALTTFVVLYDLLQYLGWDLPHSMHAKAVRPSDEVLDSGYKTLTSRLDDLFEYCGLVRQRLEAVSSARDLRSPKNAEGDGHPFMRPVVQKAVARVVSEIIQQGLATWETLMDRLSELPWTMGSAPWTAVFSDSGKMLTGKENTELLCELLHAHLAPSNFQAIKRARKNFKDIRGMQYPFSEEELGRRVSKAVHPLGPVVHPEEVSSGPSIIIPKGEGQLAESPPAGGYAVGAESDSLDDEE